MPVLAFRAVSFGKKTVSISNEEVSLYMKNVSQAPRESISLQAQPAHLIRHVDERLMSYNIEMTEVTGGTFWKSYTAEQIAGTQEFPTVTVLTDVTAMPELMQCYPPIDLTNKRLRELARQLGPAWVRVSGTWATKTYYDLDGVTGGKPPEGYANVLTGEQWLGVLDFVSYVGAKLLISVSNCAGDHPNGEALDLTQAKKIFDFSHHHGVDISAVEFMNEPNMLELSGAPKGYTAADYARDQDILYAWVRANYPKCLLVGPCTTGDPSVKSVESKDFGAGIAALTKTCTTQELLEETQIPLDVFSYHYYNGVSERIAGVIPSAHWPGQMAHTDAYLAVAPACAKAHTALRDKFVPGGPMWVTESGDAGGGGNTWASTYLDVLRTLNELGSYGTITDGVIFHNTLASSDYGFLEPGSFLPRPNYYAVLLWNRLMGTAVYDCEAMNRDSAHVYCRSRKDGKPGAAYLIVNNSLTDALTVTLPKEAMRYTLHAQTMRSPTVLLNGKELTISGVCRIPELAAQRQPQGNALLAPGSCTFLIL